MGFVEIAEGESERHPGIGDASHQHVGFAALD